MKKTLYKTVFKRIFDILFAAASLLLLSPVFLAVWLALTLANAGKPFFFQQRPGLHGHIFRIVKFKTMNDRRDAEGHLLPDAQRLTAVGRFVRKTSLDEIPQLFNVLLGDMSLVGPRPLLPEYLPLYNPTQARRHEVRPGITGWAQVNGRNAISWEQKFDYDVWYADHQSFRVDVYILWITAKKVILRKGITAVDGGAVLPFRGTRF